MLNSQRQARASSPVIACFPEVLTAIENLITAERELSGYTAQDPAVDAWIRDAETTLRFALNEIETLIALPSFHDADAHLKRVAKLIQSMLLSADPAQVAYLRRLAGGTDRFLLEWGSQLHFRLNQMILTALDQFETLLVIDDGTDSAANVTFSKHPDGPSAPSA